MPPRKIKRSDGRYAATMRFEDPLTGAKRRAYFYGRTQAEASSKARCARERLAVGSPVRDASRTLADWLAEWRSTFLRASDRAQANKVLYEGLTRRHVESHIGNIPLGRLQPVDVTRMLLAMEEAGASHRAESGTSYRRKGHQ
jgi:integrase